MKTYISILFVFYSSILHAQVVQEWRYDNTIVNPLVTITDIAYDGRNSFVAIQDFDQNQSTYLQKLDFAGNLLQMDTIQNSYSICENRMVRDNQGSIYVCGQKDLPIGSKTKITITKFDSLLNKQWSVSAIDSIQLDYYSPRICYSHEENKIYIICQKFHANGYSSAILKFNTDGVLLWESDSLSPLGLNCIRFTKDNTGNIILGGFVDFPGTDQDFTIIKIDTSGKIVWNVSMHHLLDDRVEYLVTDNENNIYAFGYFSDARSSQVIKYDSSGNFIWATGINGFYGSKLTTNNSDIFVAGVDSITNNLTVIKVDLVGNIVGSKFTNQSASGIINIKCNSQSQVYVCYTSDSLNDYRWAVTKLDSFFNVAWTILYPDTILSFSYSTSFHLLDDGFIVSGKIDPFISTVRFRETISLNLADAVNLKLNYWPNPTKNVLHFEDIENSNQIFYFKLYDINSKCLYDKYSRFEFNGHGMINLPELKKGIYFFRLKIGEHFYTNKLIIL